MATEGLITLGIGSTPGGLRWFMTFGLSSAVLPHGVVGIYTVLRRPTITMVMADYSPSVTVVTHDLAD
jgi:hypothetical protein